MMEKPFVIKAKQINYFDVIPSIPVWVSLCNEHGDMK